MDKGRRPSVRDKKSALLKASKAVFNKKGYHDTTVAAIAAEAGVATGSFYSYFSSKESCFLGLVDTLYERLMAGVLQARSQERTGEAKLLASVRAALSVFFQDPELSRLVVGALHGGQPMVRQRIESIAQDLTGLLQADLLELGDGRIAPGEAGVLALFLMGGLERALDAVLAGRRVADPDSVARALAGAARGVIFSLKSN